MRSTAVLFVLVNHLLLFLRLTRDGEVIRPLGHFGVLLFFVHTSLVLMLSLERQSQFRYLHPYREFFVRRCFRVYPLSALVVATVVLLHLPVGHFEYGQFLPARLDGWTVTSNLLLVQNLTRTESVMDSLWSLPYEMQMYLALPALFVLANASRRMLPLLGAWAASGLVALALAPTLQTDFFDYVPCFMAGVVAYKLRSAARRLPAVGWPIAILVITAAFLGHPGLKGGWICCLLVGLTVHGFRELRSGRLRTVCHLIARYSYGIYLCHGICIWLAFVKLAPLPPAIRWPLFLSMLVLFPMALYHGVEAPMIALGGRAVQRFARLHQGPIEADLPSQPTRPARMPA